MAVRSTVEERQTDEARKAEERAAREQQRIAHAAIQSASEARQRDEQERAAFNASPPEQARQARRAGLRFFQWTMPIEDVDRTWTAKFTHEMTTRVHSVGDAVGATLTAIEDEGWELAHAGFLFRETAQASPDEVLAGEEQSATIGQTVGVYLFTVRTE